MDHKKDIVNFRLSETLIGLIKSPAFLIKLDKQKRPDTIISCNRQAQEYFNIDPFKVEGTKVRDLQTRDKEVVPWKDIKADQNGDLFSYSIPGEGSVGFTRYFQVTGRPSFLDKKKYAFIALFEVTREVNKDTSLQIQQQMQKVIADLLNITSLEMTLEQILDRILSKIISINWKSIENKGCIFIYDKNKEKLVMRAKRNLGIDIGTLCSEIPLGKCICGRVGLTKEIYFSNTIDENHEIRPEGMTPHGHCAVPIVSHENEILGVLNLYIKHNHKFDDNETAFLQTVAQVIAMILRYKMEHNKNEELRKQVFMSSKMASLGDLAAGIAHEINNPLMVIKGNIERFKDSFVGCNTAKCMEHKEIIEAQERSIETIISITSGLKGYARMKQTEEGALDLHTIINETINLIRFIYSRDGVKFNIELKAEKHHLISSYVKVQQILMNLFSNARDAMTTSKEKIITVQTKNRGDKLILKIADTGHGITKENRVKVFDKYFTTKELGKGTGLGMGIVKSILDSMDASASLASKLGTGTIFSFVFKAAEKEAEKAIETETLKEMKLEGKVLVVDDSPELLEIFNFYLMKLGMQVFKTESPKEALSYLEKDKFDYLITDLKMDEMGGTELAEEARACGFNDLKILLVSADIEALNKLSSGKVKYHDGFIQKPFSKENLYKALVGIKK